jgi:hypothetical protein
MKSVQKVAPPAARATPVDVSHYIDPHIWGQGGETIAFEIVRCDAATNRPAQQGATASGDSHQSPLKETMPTFP